MSRVDELVNLFNLITHGAGWKAKPPTLRSLSKIKEDLGVDIPDLYRHVGTMCPNYSAFLNGIGEDYNSVVHIVTINRTFHSASDGAAYLAPNLVAVNHGADLGFDCLDLRDSTKEGGYPIIRVQFIEGHEIDGPPPGVQATDVKYDSFDQYFESITLYYAKVLCASAVRIDNHDRVCELFSRLNNAT